MHTCVLRSSGLSSQSISRDAESSPRGIFSRGMREQYYNFISRKFDVGTNARTISASPIVLMDGFLNAVVRAALTSPSCN